MGSRRQPTPPEQLMLHEANSGLTADHIASVMATYINTVAKQSTVRMHPASCNFTGCGNRSLIQCAQRKLRAKNGSYSRATLTYQNHGKQCTVVVSFARS